MKSILVINALNGTLPLVLRTKYSHATITCAEVFPFYKHHLRNLGFEVTDWEGLSDMKFDMIVGNPPYQLTASKKLWPEFILKSLNLLNPDAHLAMVVPATWLTSDGAVYKKVRQTLTTSHNLLHVNRDADTYFDVGQDICYFVAHTSPYAHETEYVHNKQTTLIDLTQGVPRSVEQQQIDSILDNMLSHEPKIWWELNERDDCIKSAHIQPTCSPTHKYKVFQSTARVGYVDKRPPDMGKLKLAVNFSSSFYSAHASDHNMPITKHGVGSLMGYVLVPDVTHGEYLRSYLCTKAIRFLVTHYKKAHTGFNTAVKRRQIPQPPHNQIWTDAQVYDLFKFDKQQIALIESVIK